MAACWHLGLGSPHAALPHAASAPSLPLLPSFSFPFLLLFSFPPAPLCCLRPQNPAQSPHPEGAGPPGEVIVSRKAEPDLCVAGFSWYGLWLLVSFKTKIRAMKVLSISGVFWGRHLWGPLGRRDRTSLILFLEMVWKFLVKSRFRPSRALPAN